MFSKHTTEEKAELIPGIIDNLLSLEKTNKKQEKQIANLNKKLRETQKSLNDVQDRLRKKEKTCQM